MGDAVFPGAARQARFGVGRRRDLVDGGGPARRGLLDRCGIPRSAGTFRLSDPAEDTGAAESPGSPASSAEALPAGSRLWALIRKHRPRRDRKRRRRPHQGGLLRGLRFGGRRGSRRVQLVCGRVGAGASACVSRGLGRHVSGCRRRKPVVPVRRGGQRKFTRRDTILGRGLERAAAGTHPVRPPVATVDLARGGRAGLADRRGVGVLAGSLPVSAGRRALERADAASKSFSDMFSPFLPIIRASGRHARDSRQALSIHRRSNLCGVGEPRRPQGRNPSPFRRRRRRERQVISTRNDHASVRRPEHHVGRKRERSHAAT